MGPSKKSIRRLQLIQNAAVRIIRSTTKVENITPILKSLR